MEDENKIPPIIKYLSIFVIIEAMVMIILYLFNGQQRDALLTGITAVGVLLILYLSIKMITKNMPYFFENKNNSLRYIIALLGVIFMLLIMFSLDKLTYQIGSIQVTFPKEKGFVYGEKDGNNDYNHAYYYFDYCSIEVKKVYNNTNYSIFDNMKKNMNLESKITDEIRIKDIYNSEFTEGKETINEKEWNTFYTKVETINYTIYYTVIDNYIYQINTENYNINPDVCTKKIDQTFKTIKYSN